MNRTSCRKADRLWTHGVGLREARVGLGTGHCQGETSYQFLRLTIACSRQGKPETLGLEITPGNGLLLPSG